MASLGYTLIRAISWFANILILALFVRAIMSWFVRDEYSSLGKVYVVLAKLTEPVVAPCRSLLSRWNTGMFDFSVLLAFFLVQIVERVLIYIITIVFML